MSEVTEGSSPDTAGVIGRLERRVRYLSVGVALLGVGLIVLAALVLRENLATHKWFVTRHLVAREFYVPPTSDWQSVTASGGLALAVDGKSVTFWLSGSPLSDAGQQTRIELDGVGSQSLVMIDKLGHVRLQLAVAADGTPSMSFYGADGKPTWSALENGPR